MVHNELEIIGSVATPPFIQLWIMHELHLMLYSQYDKSILIFSRCLHERQHQSTGADLWPPWNVCPAPIILACLITCIMNIALNLHILHSLDYQAEAIAMSVVKPKVWQCIRDKLWRKYPLLNVVLILCRYHQIWWLCVASTQSLPCVSMDMWPRLLPWSHSSGPHHLQEGTRTSDSILTPLCIRCFNV